MKDFTNHDVGKDILSNKIFSENLCFWQKDFRSEHLFVETLHLNIFFHKNIAYFTRGIFWNVFMQYVHKLFWENKANDSTHQVGTFYYGKQSSQSIYLAKNTGCLTPLKIRFSFITLTIMGKHIVQMSQTHQDLIFGTKMTILA